MNRLFGKRSEKAPMPITPAVDPPAADQISDTIDLLDKLLTWLDRLVSKEITAAQSYGAGQKKKQALECLKRKRMYEMEQDQLRIKKMNLMSTGQTLNAVKFNSLVTRATAAGAAEIARQVKADGGVDGVEKVNDQLEDALDDAREILGASARPFGEAADLDDDELLEELEQELQVADATRQLTTVRLEPTPARDARSLFAQVPSTVPTVQHPSRAEMEAQEERELAELAQLQSSMVIEQPMPMPMMAACH